MHIQLLGTGGYHPNEIRHTTSLLLPELEIGIDAGTAAFRLAERLPGKHLDLFLTHPHWDHIIGLTYLFVPMLLEKIETVTLYGNQHTLDAVRTHLFAEPTFSHMPAFELVPLEEFGTSSVRLQNARIHWKSLPSHPGGSTAYLIEQNQTRFAFVTDTYVDGSYTDFIRGADLLVHECYFSDEMSEWAEKTGHSFLSQVAELAREAEVDQLLLTHIDPRETEVEPWDLTSARQIFSPTAFARDLQDLHIR